MKRSNKKKKSKINISHVSDSYIAITDFGLRFEDGEPGLIRMNDIIKVLEVEKTRVRLEKIGWVNLHNVVFKFLKPCKPHQYTIEEIIKNS